MGCSWCVELVLGDFAVSCGRGVYDGPVGTAGIANNLLGWVGRTNVRNIASIDGSFRIIRGGRLCFHIFDELSLVGLVIGVPKQSLLMGMCRDIAAWNVAQTLV